MLMLMSAHGQQRSSDNRRTTRARRREH